jgi:hypothetical protein
MRTLRLENRRLRNENQKLKLSKGSTNGNCPNKENMEIEGFKAKKKLESIIEQASRMRKNSYKGIQS